VKNADIILIFIKIIVEVVEKRILCLSDSQCRDWSVHLIQTLDFIIYAIWIVIYLFKNQGNYSSKVFLLTSLIVLAFFIGQVVCIWVVDIDLLFSLMCFRYFKDGFCQWNGCNSWHNYLMNLFSSHDEIEETQSLFDE